MNRLYLFDLLRGLEYLEKHFRDPINAAEAARAAGYSPWHYNRIFQQYLGESVSRYLLRLRLEAGKTELRSGRSVEETALRVGFRTREGFAKAFRTRYGVSPGRYACGEAAKERYGKVCEYRMSSPLWDLGANPTPDGLWEFSYHVPGTDTFPLMRWNGEYFEAPYAQADLSDPAWYCRNRFNGYGLHPGKETEPVKSFICPESGVLEYFISLGRMSELYDGSNPCAVYLLHNETPLSPDGRPTVLSDRQPIVFQGIRRVTAGDRIRLCENSMGNIGRDGVMLYRQRMAYLNEIKEEGIIK